MATTTLLFRRITGAGSGSAVYLLLLLVLFTASFAEAQSPPSNNNNGSSNNNNINSGMTNFNPSMAIVIVVLISAFFFLGFFSIYIKQCARGGSVGGGRSWRGGGVGSMRARLQRGLDPEVLETFPTLVYSEVKGLKIGKESLECAVCLCEFEDEETLRLLPKCSHAFHPDCIDAWLASHVTCPVCRSDLTAVKPDEFTPDSFPVSVAAGADLVETETTPLPPPQVVISVDEEDKKQEMAELLRIGSQKRALKAKSIRAGARFPRSHSTGHSLLQPGENLDRYTLKLPAHIHKEIMAARELKRTTSCVGFPSGGEGSSRRGYRGGGGEGSFGRGRSIRLGKPEGLLPSFLARTFSARVLSWRSGEGSTRKGAAAAADFEGGSSKGRFPSFKNPFESRSIGGGGARPDNLRPFPASGGGRPESPRTAAGKSTELVSTSPRARV